MLNTKNLQTAVEAVFSEREKFIVLGVTGRTGSGCTTLASLLKNQHFSQFGAPLPKSPGCGSIDERQYRIIYQFLQKNWNAFYVISAADVITSFIIEHDFEVFVQNYSTLNSISADDVKAKIDPGFIDQYNKIHQERLEIRKKVSENEERLEDDDVYDFNFIRLPNFTATTKATLDKLAFGSYTKFYQLAANNIRRSGSSFCSDFDPHKIFVLAQRVNSFIKQLRKRQKITGGRVLVCIDAIRNSFEASFFRERYSAFYLVSVATDEAERRRRLRANGYPDATIDQIDAKECPKKLSDAEFFYSQNVQKCVEMADIHIYNPHDAVGAQREIKKQISKYLALIMHPGLVQPTDLERCMQIAIGAKLNSGCLSRQVGAVITDEFFSVKAIGWNNAPEGQAPCSHRTADDLMSAEDSSAFSDYENTDTKFREKFESIYAGTISGGNTKGWPLSYCFKDIQNCVDGEKNQVHTRALHAEENAFLQITKYGGQGIKGGYLFTTSSPCELCAKKAYQLGISKIYYLDPYPGIAGTHVLGVGDARPQVVPFVGALSRGYQQLFEPVMPHKEAMKALVALDIPNVKSDLKRKIQELEFRCKTLSDENERFKREEP